MGKNINIRFNYFNYLIKPVVPTKYKKEQKKTLLIKELSYELEDWQTHGMHVSNLPSRTCTGTPALPMASRYSLTILNPA